MKSIKKYQKENKVDDRLRFGREKDGVIFPVASVRAVMPSGYSALLLSLKKRISHERLRVVLSSNAALVMLYWDIGQSILNKQNEKGWGAKIIDRLSADLKKEFPDMKGFSPRNLKYMRAFAAAWTDKSIVQQLAAQIPWFQLYYKYQSTKQIKIWYN